MYSYNKIYYIFTLGFVTYRKLTVNKFRVQGRLTVKTEKRKTFFIRVIDSEGEVSGTNITDISMLCNIFIMLLRYIISYIGVHIYKRQYALLRNRLLIEFKKLKEQPRWTNMELFEKLLISGEDHRFNYHIGFDIIAIFRAIKNKIFYNKIEGASTIDQQLVRVLINDYNKTFKRKVKEILLATTLIKVIPREYIPTIYLQVAYYGTGMNGLEQVFNKLQIKDPNSISIELCAEIIARIKYPEPKVMSKNRSHKIELRKMHLLYLYKNHSSKKYFPIYG